MQETFIIFSTENAFELSCKLATPCKKTAPHIWDLGPEWREKWEIDRSEIHKGRELGRGNYGIVYYGKWAQFEVAVKTLKKNSMSPEAFLKEAAIMKDFRHKNLISLYAICSNDEPIYIVQEYMSKGSLLDFLRSEQGALLKFEELVCFAAQIASGMEYLESKQLVHGGLAARNVMIGENNVVKICDFGLARVVADDDFYTKQGSECPVKWTAPEAIGFGRFSIKSDVW